MLFRSVLEVSHVSVAGESKGAKLALDDVGFVVHSGEVLGIAGVEGNGQLEVCEAILGLRSVLPGGSVHLEGRDITHEPTGHRLRSGISYIPFDRHREGLTAMAFDHTRIGRIQLIAPGNQATIDATRCFFSFEFIGQTPCFS